MAIYFLDWCIDRVKGFRLLSGETENELKFLKAQTKPNFLFNAINSIYILIKKDPDLAQATLARFSAAICNNAREANWILSNEKIDLMFLDIKMPGMRGIDFLKTLQTKPIVIIAAMKKFFSEIFYLLRRK